MNKEYEPSGDGEANSFIDLQEKMARAIKFQSQGKHTPVKKTKRRLFAILNPHLDKKHER